MEKVLLSPHRTNLSVSALLHHGHDDVLGGHEGQLLLNMPLDDARVHHQALADVLQRHQHAVRREERL